MRWCGRAPKTLPPTIPRTVNCGIDNASAFQKVGQLFEGQVSIDSDDEDDVLVDPDEEDTWEVIIGALQILVTEGIFCIRCAAHSLQLVWELAAAGFISVISGAEGL